MIRVTDRTVHGYVDEEVVNEATGDRKTYRYYFVAGAGSEGPLTLIGLTLHGIVAHVGVWLTVERPEVTERVRGRLKEFIDGLRTAV